MRGSIHPSVDGRNARRTRKRDKTMQKISFTNRLASAAMLALAALPMAALATAANAGPAVVSVNDLNLMTPQGNAMLEQRIDVAAQKFCLDRKAVSDVAVCRAGARAELVEKADSVRRAQQAALTHSYAAR